MVWPYIVITVSIIGLGAIFFRKYQKANELEKMKMHMNETRKEELEKQAAAEAKKKAEIDYQAVSRIFNKADLLMGQGNYKEAQKGFVHVLALYPDHTEANVKLGGIYLQEGKFSKAEEIFTHVVTLDPRKANYYNSLAKALYGLRKLDEAKQSYEAAVKLDASDVDSYVNLGHVYVELKMDKKAINAYSKALTLNPKLTNLYFLMTDLLIKLNALGEAVACMETLLETQPYNEQAKKKLRDIKVKRGDDPLKNKSKKKRDPLGGEQNSLF